MGYEVTLLRGDAVIPADRHPAALDAVQALNQRDDLKGGWSRVVLPDGTFGRRPHWSFVKDDELAAATTLTEALAAWRFVAVLNPDGDMVGVSLEGGTRNKGDEGYLWSALAPFVEAGGELLWHGEDDRVWRWTFDGRGLQEQVGRIVFDRE